MKKNRKKNLSFREKFIVYFWLKGWSLNKIISFWRKYEYDWTPTETTLIPRLEYLYREERRTVKEFNLEKIQKIDMMIQRGISKEQIMETLGLSSTKYYELSKELEKRVPEPREDYQKRILANDYTIERCWKLLSEDKMSISEIAGALRMEYGQVHYRAGILKRLRRSYKEVSRFENLRQAYLEYKARTRMPDEFISRELGCRASDIEICKRSLLEDAREVKSLYF